MSGIPAGAGSLLGKRLGKYEILALLALGGTAEIYLARIAGAAGFEKYVVVKCLHDHLADDGEFVKMFLDEARLAAHLDHSNIVQTMELGEHEHRYYMVMEFLAGLSLAMIVRRAAERLPGGRIPVPLVLNMIAQSCAGLHYAHERVVNGKPLNIVHRDISPQNLVVSFEGVVKVVDFGIAKAELRETRTRSGTIKGKFAYMSPEQCVANNVDRRTDVFALGVIAHELLTGRRLFKKPSPYETYQAVMECAVEPPSKLNVELDPAVDAVIMRAVAKDKDARYATAEEFGDALLGYLHHRGKGSGPGDVSRFFDASFGQEIEEHGARMRELISGREKAVEPVTWGAEDDERRYESVDQPLDAAPDPGAGASAGSLSQIIDDIGQQPGADDGDIPAEKTRIEANPLERLNELEAEHRARSGAPAPGPAAGPAPTAPLRPLVVPGIPSGPLATMPPGGADFSSQPTVLAQPQRPGPELARTELGARPLEQTMLAAPPYASGPPPGYSNGPPPGYGDPQAGYGGPQAGYGGPQAEYGGPNGPGPGQHGPAPGQHGGPPMGYGAPQGANGHGGDPSMQGPPGGYDPNQTHAPMPLGGPPRPGASQPPVNIPMQRPVMDAQMSANMASGATVFPSNAGRAAELASPVGGQLAENVDWAAAAAAPARAIPTWALAMMFLGAIGVALLVTVLIARLAT